jgi:hypothetical protein
VLLYPTRDGEIRLTPGYVRPGSSFLNYVVLEMKEKTKTKPRRWGWKANGILYNGGAISFKAKANNPYCLYIAPYGMAPAPKVGYELSIAHAAVAAGQFEKGTLYLQGKAAPLYVHVPEGMNLSCSADSSGVVLKTQTDLEAALKDYPDARAMQELNEGWRFKTDPDHTGEKRGFGGAELDVRSWKPISVEDYWQNQGFGDYHGTAWYRKTFTAPAVKADQRLLLFFGSVDGDAVVYLNGKKVGEHLPSKLGNGWDKPFALNVTGAMKPGRNVIAVEVSKDLYVAGIYKGVRLMAWK